MPGSRESEVKRLLPELLAAVVIIKQQDSRFNTLTLQFSFNQKIKIRCINANKNIGLARRKIMNYDFLQPQ
jgi:lipid A disaccharide synthetase